MNHCAMRQQNAFASREEIRAPFAERRPPVFCPKPRRLSQFATAVADPLRTPLRCHSSYQIDFSDSKAGADLLDIFLRKGEDQTQVASSPPFFCGSPPSRAANPVIHDARFGEDRPPPPALFPPSPLTQTNPPMSPKQGRVHAKFGLVPATVRVEGFDCLNRRHRSRSSITAVA